MPALRDATAFRRLRPSLIEEFDIAHPALPAELDGLTVLHVSDLHSRRFAPRSAAFQRLAHALASVEVDLVVFTGDLMDAPGQELGAIQTLAALAEQCRVRVASLAVFGNHDTPVFRRLAPPAIPAITFLNNEFLAITVRGQTHHVLGLSHPEDPLAAWLKCSTPRPFLTLAHHPTCLIACADFGVPLVLAGHTHAGQIRVSPKLAPHTSSDIPAHLATGALRLRQTLMLISRGVGDGVVETLRINCAQQLPLYTLRRGPMPALPRGVPENVVTQVLAW